MHVDINIAKLLTFKNKPMPTIRELAKGKETKKRLTQVGFRVEQRKLQAFDRMIIELTALPSREQALNYLINYVLARKGFPVLPESEIAQVEEQLNEETPASTA